MNPQMQNYQRYAQAQVSRTPASGRRPGKCDSSTNVPPVNGYSPGPGLVAPSLIGPQLPRPLSEPQRLVHQPVISTSPERQSTFTTPQAFWRARNNDDPQSSDNSAQQQNYRQLLPSPARLPRLEYPPPYYSPSYTPAPSPEQGLGFTSPASPGTPTPAPRVQNRSPSRKLTADLVDQGPLSPVCPRTLRLARLRNDMNLYKYQAYGRLGQTQMYENQDLQSFYAVPNQHANLAAQQHQQQLYQQQMAQRNAAVEHQLAQRRARKPTDLNMPEGLEDIIIGDGVQQYKALREAEKKLDYTMMRKRLDIQDTLNRNVRRQKTMRIWINNTCEHQPWQRPPLDGDTFDFNTGEDSTFSLQIRGKLIDDDSDSSDEEEDMDEEEKTKRTERPKPAPKKFSHYFKGISVDYEIHQLNPTMPIDPAVKMDWKKTPQSYEFDMMNFNRKGDENQNITISLLRDEPVERYRLSTALANTLDIEEADRAEVVMGIWEYVKAMGLQEDDERRHVRCDERLKSIFNTDAFLFPQVAERIMPHLHPLPPIKLPYTIRLDEAFQSTVTPEDPRFTIYDVKITVEDPLRAKILAITQSSQSVQNLRQINAINDQLAVIIQAIHHHKAKHTFYKSFARDPVGFLKKWMSSQQRDLAVILGENDLNDTAGLQFAKGGSDGIWGSDIVQEAVRYKLAKDDAETRRP